MGLHGDPHHHDLQACDILPDLQRAHPGRLPASLVRVRIVQTAAAVWLERTSRRGRPWLEAAPPQSSATVVERDVLSGFIACGQQGELLFDPSTSALDNARAFMELTPYTLINVTNLFSEEEACAVDEGYRQGGAAAADCWAVPFGTEHCQEYPLYLKASQKPRYNTYP